MSVAQLRDIDLFSPSTLAEASEKLASAVRDQRTVWAIAGCTDWMVERHMQSATDQLAGALAIDLSRLGELRGIELDGRTVRIGATETFTTIRNSQVIQAHAPLLADVAATVGAKQIQNRATLGGNLVSGSPAADGVTALFALDAEVVLLSERGQRTVPIRQFYTGYRSSVRQPDEIVVRFEFRAMSPQTAYLWKKVGTRRAQSIAKASVAALLLRDQTGVVRRVGFGVGSVAERVVDLSALRSLLDGKSLDEIDFSMVTKTVDNGIRPIDDLRSTAAYRRHVVRQIVTRFLRESAGKQ